MRYLLLIWAMVLALGSCKERRVITPAIYYWKTVYKPTAFEQKQLKGFGCKTVYLHYFDIGWDEAAGAPTPVAVMHMPEQMDSALNYIPVIFITQEVFPDLRKNQVPEFAQNIDRLTASVSSNARVKPKEIQIDCDWTYKSRDAYFALLEELRRQAFFKDKTLSCTIRMHQVKYTTKSGIPPVDRGLLMCYNMGNIKDPRTKNSILDNEIAEEYLGNMDSYPLPLDVALPLFDWALQFRGKKLEGILRDINKEKLEAAPFLEKKKDNTYICKADTMWERYELRKGDKIRWEESAYTEIKKMAEYTAKRLRNKDAKLAFFHCDSVTLSKYSPHELEKIVGTYR